MGVDRLLRKAYNKWFRPDPLRDLTSRGLVVGRNLKILPGATIDWSHCWFVKIGDDVTLAPGVRLIAHDASMKMHLGYARIGKIEIGDRVFIGAGSIVLPGVSIGSDTVIGAGSVVSRSIPGGMVACGNPARVMGTTSGWLDRKRAEMINVPCFGEEYTMRGGITEAMRAEMNARMADGVGYVE